MALRLVLMVHTKGKGHRYSHHLDYLVKPFSSRELLARVSARLELTRVRVAAALKEQALREAAERANATKDLFLAALRCVSLLSLSI